LFFTGKKSEEKHYYKHTGFPGGLRRKFAKDLMKDNPAKILIKAVKGMLPKNRLQAKRLDRLKVFADDNHPYKMNISKSFIK